MTPDDEELPVETAPGVAPRRGFRVFLETAVTLLPGAGLATVVVVVGWPHAPSVEEGLVLLTRVVAVLYGSLFLLHWFLFARAGEVSRVRRWVLPLIALLLMASALAEGLLPPAGGHPVGAVSVRTILLTIAAGQQVVAFALRFATWIPALEDSFVRKLNPGTVLFGSFALLIVAGTLLLELPNASTGKLGWLDAFFTSTSAVCVTGLIVVDTATAFTPLGQAILLGLIQTGAFGIVTLTFFLAVVTGQGFSVASRLLLRDVLNLDNLRHLGTAILLIVVATLAVEALGWAALARYWSSAGLPVENVWWVALFHSVSAFCNAGFSLFSAGLADPRAVSNFPVQAVIMILIVLGGIGFPVVGEVLGRFRARGAGRRLGLHSRLVLATTGVLLVGGTVLLYAADPGRPGEGGLHRLWFALFNAITARTAGFNLSDMAMLSSAATALVILLMFIGGSPGGFAGGIKTTTFALSMLNLRRIVLARREVEVYGRRIDDALCNRAFAVLLLSFTWIFAATAVILFVQPQFTLLDTLFETVSAFSTVGLSRGITPHLSVVSKMVIIATMFVGRIGVMNFFFSLLVVAPPERRLRMPRERIIIE